MEQNQNPRSPHSLHYLPDPDYYDLPTNRENIRSDWSRGGLGESRTGTARGTLTARGVTPAGTCPGLVPGVGLGLATRGGICPGLGWGCGCKSGKYKAGPVPDGVWGGRDRDRDRDKDWDCDTPTQSGSGPELGLGLGRSSGLGSGLGLGGGGGTPVKDLVPDTFIYRGVPRGVTELICEQGAVCENAEDGYESGKILGRLIPGW